jgi:protein-tyrosine phosphatase
MTSISIPIPEGLAPASLELFDTHLTRLISVYTLAGVPVLAHCRGGVGRAGLVACCWMLKLGLCGWVPTSDSSDVGDEGQVRRETLEQVEKVIGVVRRRRSLKAIETYEQVKFLVGYVDYLRGRRSR